jgi:hypothetical protein
MKKIKLIGIMFFLSLCSYFVVIYDNTIRTVEFLSIFAAGALGGILGIRIEDYLKNKKILIHIVKQKTTNPLCYARNCYDSQANQIRIYK